MLTLLRQTLRRLTHEAGFTATALLTLALCIGANVAIFAVVDAILVRPLPFPKSDRIVVLHNSYPRAGAPHIGGSFTNYYDRRHALKAYSSISLHQGGSVIVGDEGAPTRVQIGRITPEFFTTLGIPLALGHMFTDANLLNGTNLVAILSDGYWRNHFNADPQIVGKTFINDGLPTTILGVLPRGFDYLTDRAQFYCPASHGKDDIRPSSRHNNDYQMIARLAPGVSLAQAQAEVNAFNEKQLKDDPNAVVVRNAGWFTEVVGLHADYVHDIRPILLLLQTGVIALLLIGGINLVNLLLIRANGRAKEFAVRQALGAGRRHLVREVMTETVLLALGGGGLGLLLGAFGVDLLTRLGTDELPLGRAIQLDGRLAVVTALASVIVGLALALPVIFTNLRHRLAPVLQSESRTGTVSRAAQRLRHTFIVIQISLAFVLLTGAGLLRVSLQKIMAESPGFRPDHVLTGAISLPWKSYKDGPARKVFLARLDTALRALPGVTAAGFTSGLPLDNNTNDNAITVEGVQLASGQSIRTHFTSFAMGDYWLALGIPLVSGRLLTDADNQGNARVCVVDTEFAKRYWPHESALGHRIVSDVHFIEDKATTIVGVVGPVKQNDLADTNALGAVYFPYKDYSSDRFSVIVRTSLAPEAIAETLRKTVLALDPALPVDPIKTMQSLIDQSLISRRSPAILGAAFAGVALLLATVGTYGVLAYAVSQRRREIGVRMALGALPEQVLRQFLALGAKLLATGLGLGLVGSWLAGQAMQSLLFGVGTVDAGVLALAAVTMIVVVLFATFIPARRATKVDPIVALRAD